MKKNVASQSIGAEMITAADGTAFTGAVTVLITIDNGTQSASGGTAPAHEGNGYHSYTPTQAETNGDHIAFTFTGTGAIPATVQVFTAFPQTVDNNVLAAGVTGFAAIDTVVDAILVDTAEIGTAGAGLTNIGTIATVTTLTGHTPQTGDTYALANGATGFAAIDTVVDAILVDTGTTIPATITTAQNDLDIITGASGVNLLTATQATIDAAATAASIAALNDIAATDIVSAGAITTLTGAVVNVDLVDTCTTNTDMRGTNSALLASSINLTAGAVDNVTTVATTTTNTDMRGTDSALLAASINLTGGAVDTVTTVTNQVTADTTAIAGVTAAATNLSKSAIGIEPGAAITGTLSTTQMTTDLTEVTDDHYNGRIIVWTSGVLKNQATDITDYTGASKLLTYTATTEAPANTDTFVII